MINAMMRIFLPIYVGICQWHLTTSGISCSASPAENLLLIVRSLQFGVDLGGVRRDYAFRGCQYD
jgi:hypothetical protein